MSEKIKILVVEDNDFVRMQIVRYLAETGADILEASQGQKALDLIKHDHLRDDPITLAVVDVRMEPVDGFEFIRTIRGMDIDMPVILVTGDNNPDLLEKAGQWGVGAVMIKPVQKDRLVMAVNRTLDARKRKG